MLKRVLVTGGAGFIGSHIVDRLVVQGYEVIVYDNLDPQVHKDGKPDYLNKEAEFIEGDVRDRQNLSNALKGVHIISHQAAVVGVGQSMYEIERYMDSNVRGTATLLDVVVNDYREIEKLVVASSMSIYGEGEYFCESCGEVTHPPLRDKQQMKRRQWELRCPRCNSPLGPKATPESKPLNSNSIYAISKKVQEEMCLLIGRTYGIPTVALRYFNVYGPRQSLSNPYTGVAAIFGSRIKNNNPPLIFEDGKQTRDFLHVTDVAVANQLAIENSNADMQAINIGTGVARSIEDVAQTLIWLYDKEGGIEPRILGKFREGDIRHCYADISKAKETLGFVPSAEFESRMRELAEWGLGQEAEDRFEVARAELVERGLTEL